MKLLIEEKHLEILIRHGKVSRATAQQIVHNPLFTPGAQLTIEELTEALEAAQTALPPMDALDLFICEQEKATTRPEILAIVRKRREFRQGILNPAPEGNTIP